MQCKGCGKEIELNQDRAIVTMCKALTPNKPDEIMNETYWHEECYINSPFIGEKDE